MADGEVDWGAVFSEGSADVSNSSCFLDSSGLSSFAAPGFNLPAPAPSDCGTVLRWGDARPSNSSCFLEYSGL